VSKRTPARAKSKRGPAFTVTDAQLAARWRKVRGCDPPESGRQVVSPSVPKDPKRTRRGVKNGWEASFEREYLDTHPTTAGCWRRFDALSLTLYDGSADVRGARYTPDFIVAIPKPETQSWQLIAFEVKGHRRQAGIVRIKAAAACYPWISFCLVTGGPSNWSTAWL
jgi:hypothetical protein